MRRAGLERVIVVDLTKPELGVPVARVIIPGLETKYLNPRFRAGRRAVRVAERML